MYVGKINFHQCASNLKTEADKRLLARAIVTLSVAILFAISLTLAVTLKTFYYVAGAFPLIFLVYFMKEICASAILSLPCNQEDSSCDDDETIDEMENISQV